jgi:hypothetical protein
MQNFSLIIVLLVSLNGCTNGVPDVKAERVALAERWFRGVYGSDPTVVDDLGSDDIVVSYPIFETLFAVPAIRGRDAVKGFATGFCSRWADTEVTFHETVVEGDRVILIWSFQGRNVGSARKDRPPTNQVHNWGGITLVRFDGAGKIVEEVGEESEPGPFKRLMDGGDTN